MQWYFFYFYFVLLYYFEDGVLNCMEKRGRPYPDVLLVGTVAGTALLSLYFVAKDSNEKPVPFADGEISRCSDDTTAVKEVAVDSTQQLQQRTSQLIGASGNLFLADLHVINHRVASAQSPEHDRPARLNLEEQSQLGGLVIRAGEYKQPAGFAGAQLGEFICAKHRDIFRVSDPQRASEVIGYSEAVLQQNHSLANIQTD